MFSRFDESDWVVKFHCVKRGLDYQVSQNLPPSPMCEHGEHGTNQVNQRLTKIKGEHRVEHG